MTTPIVTLMAQAAAAGVRVQRTREDHLDILGPPAAAPVAKLVRSRAAEVLRLFDWTHAAVTAPAPCLLCEKPAILRDPANSKPCHKVCADATLYAGHRRSRKGATV